MTEQPFVFKKSSEPETTYLYLARHGATDANLSEPYVLQGRGINKSLNPTGRNQATALGGALSNLPLSGIYTSGMQRAMETGEMVAAHHDLPVIPIEDLAECDVGLWEGMDWTSIEQQHADAYKAFIENPAENPYLGGESYGDVLNRALPIFNELLTRHVGESIAVVAHNVVNRVYLAHVLGIKLRKAQHIRQANAGVNVIRFQNGKTHVMSLNVFFHLDERLR